MCVTCDIQYWKAVKDGLEAWHDKTAASLDASAEDDYKAYRSTIMRIITHLESAAKAENKMFDINRRAGFENRDLYNIGANPDTNEYRAFGTIKTQPLPPCIE